MAIHIRPLETTRNASDVARSSESDIFRKGQELGLKSSIPVPRPNFEKDKGEGGLVAAFLKTLSSTAASFCENLVPPSQSAVKECP